MSRKVTALLHGITNLATCTMSDRIRMKTKSSLIAHLQSELKTTVQTSRGALQFLTSRGLHIAGAVSGFQNDEPETQAWIDNMNASDVFWDVGANIGVYSLYAGQRGDLDIYAFEPSGLNFGLMIEHIHINKLGAQVKPFCLAFGAKTELTTLYGNTDSVGHASNTIGKAEDQFGTYDIKFEQAVPAFTMDDFVKFYKAPYPTHLKLDVDGIEADILRGGSQVLKNLHSLMIEIEGDDQRQQDLITLITASGLKETDIPNRTDKTRNRLFVR